MTAVRRADAADARGIAEVKVESWRATYAGVVPQTVLDSMDVDAHERIWTRLTAHEQLAVFVAEREGRVIGRRLLEPAKAASLFETQLAKPWRTCR